MRESCPGEMGARDQFRNRFRQVLRRCLQKGFLLEECFGLVWEEVLESASLPEAAQCELYDELLAWANAQRTLRPNEAIKVG